MKKFFAEFKKFIQRGNVIDLAVGVIIGGAFSAIVTALTNNILMPVINWVLLKLTGGQGLDGVFTYLKKAFVEGSTTEIDLAKSIYIDWGAFITAIINFVLIALVVFCIVKAINKVSEGAQKAKAKYAPLTKEEVRALRKEGKSYGEIEVIAVNKAAELARAQQLAEEEAAKNAPKTEQQLLGEIVELLKEKK